MASNKGLREAKAGKNDEFYTQLTDIANEMQHYKEHFKGKVVLCNCDDPRVSNLLRGGVFLKSDAKLDSFF